MYFYFYSKCGEVLIDTNLNNTCREVTVIRLVCKSTIEEQMFQTAQMKLKLEKDITNTGIL